MEDGGTDATIEAYESFTYTHRQLAQVEIGNMGTISEGKVVVQTAQEHVRTVAASSSNYDESHPSEWTCPGCVQIITKAICRKCYKWRDGKRNKLSKNNNIEQPPPNVAHNSLQPEDDSSAA